MTDHPSIQLISNLVVRNAEGDVLLVRYDPDGESDAADAATRWWLPGAELEPYSHPDEAADRALADLPGLTVTSRRMAGVESFRGRRGWHLSFEYDVRADGSVTPDGEVPAAWHRLDALPRTTHGNWERSVISRVLSHSSEPASKA